MTTRRILIAAFAAAGLLGGCRHLAGRRLRARHGDQGDHQPLLQRHAGRRARSPPGEIGGTAKNYGPTQSSPQAQIDIINNLADRHVPAIAVAPSDPDAVVPAMKRAQKLGAKVITFDADSAAGRPAVPRQPGDARIRSASSAPTGWCRDHGREGQGRHRLGPADGRQPERLDRGLQGRDQEVSRHRDRRRGLWLR